MSLNALLANHEDVTNDLIPEYIKHAPESVRRRIRALKKLQLKSVDIQAEFYKKVHELETEFRAQFDTVNSQREKIVNGTYEPKDDELDAKIFSWMEDEHVKKFNDDVPSGDGKAVNGIPDFWLHTLQSVPGVGEQIVEHDEPILKYLTDITVEQKNDPPSFNIVFHFAENPFFVNKTLTKYYKLSIGPNEFEVQVMYDGPSIVESKGCEINWKEGKDVTKKTIKKRPKKGANAGKPSTKVVPNESFFRFFSPEATKVEKDMPDEVADLLNADFEAGQLIRDTVVDGAVLYYTGESVDDDDFGFDDGEDHEDGLGGSDMDEE